MSPPLRYSSPPPSNCNCFIFVIPSVGGRVGREEDAREAEPDEARPFGGDLLAEAEGEAGEGGAGEGEQVGGHAHRAAAAPAVRRRRTVVHSDRKG